MDSYLFLLIGLLVYVVFLISWAFWLYYPATLWLTDCARKSHREPGGLLALSAALQLLSIIVVGCAGVIPCVGLVVVLTGFIGWIVLGVKRYRSKAVVRAFLGERPLPRVQCSMRDIYTAVFYFAMVMALCTAGDQAAADRGMEGLVVALSAYFLLATCLGFYVALDVFRRAPEPYSAARRFWSMLAILLLFSISAVVVALIAWRSWQKALQTVGLEEWQKGRMPRRAQPLTVNVDRDRPADRPRET